MEGGVLRLVSGLESWRNGGHTFLPMMAMQAIRGEVIVRVVYWLGVELELPCKAERERKNVYTRPGNLCCNGPSYLGIRKERTLSLREYSRFWLLGETRHSTNKEALQSRKLS